MATATPGVPQAIPHKPKNTYADRIIGYSTDYYYYGGRSNNFQLGRWGAWPGPQATGADVHLVEVWDRGGGNIEYHPSRNRFFWVSDVNQKKFWHAVIGHFMREMLKIKGGARPKDPAALAAAMQPPLLAMGTGAGATSSGPQSPRVPGATSSGVRPGATSTAPRSPRPAAVRAANPRKDATSAVPEWAFDFNDLIGYTSGSDITWDDFGANQPLKARYDTSKLMSLPSVYYKGGHLTTDHGIGENIGWGPPAGDSPGMCLFFGNVLVPYIDYK